MDNALMYGPLVRLEHPSNKCPEELVFVKEVKPRFRYLASFNAVKFWNSP